MKKPMNGVRCGPDVPHTAAQQQRWISVRAALLSLVAISLVIWGQQQSINVEFVHTSTNTTVKYVTAESVEPSSPFSSFVMNGVLPFDERPSLLPLEMLKNYISQHSEESLWNDWQSNNTSHRRFAVVHFSCPHQLGNRLHHFFNDFLLAFLTNRTILWRYWDREACIQLGNQYDHSICINFNRSLSIDHPEDCQKIMETAPWIPRHDVWAERLNLPDPVQVWVRPINKHNAPHPPPDGVERLQWISNDDTNVTGVSDDWKIAVFQPLVGVQSLPFVKRQLTQQPDALSRAEAIFELGPDFWYGALFDNSFRLKPKFLESIPPVSTRNGDEESWQVNLSTLSIALHSRHINPLDDGSNVTNELNCLEKSLAEMALLNLTACRLYMLSDRPQTLVAIRDVFEQSAAQCTLVQVAHQKESTEALEAEHGPFAGEGFVQDLELASREASRSLTTVWIGHTRSSSKLLREWLIYRRAIHFWKNFGLEPSQLPTVSECQLPG